MKNVKKKINLLYCFFLILLIVISSCNISGVKEKEINQKENSYSNYGLGQVVYSILDEEQFQRLNGDSWILMDGRNIEGTDLFYNGVQNIPDARGVFIRGVNGDRNDNLGEAENYSRVVGTYQPDEFKRHVHNLNKVNSRLGGAESQNRDILIEVGDTPPNANTHYSGGLETRPRNISLYIYIKVKNENKK